MQPENGDLGGMFLSGWRVYNHFHGAVHIELNLLAGTFLLGLRVTRVRHINCAVEALNLARAGIFIVN